MRGRPSVGDRLRLSEADVMSRGTSRICYRHPRDPGQCVKVNRPGNPSVPNDIEFDYYRHLMRRNVPLRHIAACHGWVETDQGRGLVFDRIAWDGAPDGPSVDLATAILERRLPEEDLARGLEEFVRFLETYRILWTDENPTNIGVKTRPELRFVIVDGLGGRRMLDLKYLVFRSVPWLARRYTATKIKRLRKRIDALRKQAADGGEPGGRA